MATIADNSPSFGEACYAWVAAKQPEISVYQEGAVRVLSVTGYAAALALAANPENPLLKVIAVGSDTLGDGLFSLDLINTAIWWKTGKKKTGQNTVSNAVGTVRQSVVALEFSGLNLSAIAGSIGNIPIIGFGMSALRSVEYGFALWHHVRVIRENDPESLKIREQIEHLKCQLSPIFGNNPVEKERIQKEVTTYQAILADNRKKSIVSSIHCVNQIAFGIFTLVILCTGGAAAVAASTALVVYAFYVQGYGLCMFIYHLKMPDRKKDLQDPSAINLDSATKVATMESYDF